MESLSPTPASAPQSQPGPSSDPVPSPGSPPARSSTPALPPASIPSLPLRTSSSGPSSAQVPNLASLSTRSPGPAPPLGPAAIPRSPFFYPGTVFQGTQTAQIPAEAPGGAPTTEQWRVVATVQNADLPRALVCGTLAAFGVPGEDAPVTTFWRGSVVDNRRHFFRTRQWEAGLADDMAHWSELPGFTPFRESFQQGRTDALDLAPAQYVFMRWKEIHYRDDNIDGRNSIDGFYYVSLDRQSGAIAGFYFHPNCLPWQRLQLLPSAFPSVPRRTRLTPGSRPRKV